MVFQFQIGILVYHGYIFIIGYDLLLMIICNDKICFYCILFQNVGLASGLLDG